VSQRRCAPRAAARVLTLPMVLATALGTAGCRDLSAMQVVSDLGTGSGTGQIVLTQRAIAPSGFVTDASATLSRDSSSMVPMPTCTTQALAGGCTSTRCVMDPNVPPIVVVPADAGVISVTGGAAPLSFSPSPDDDTYSPSGSPMNLWQGGETLVAAAPGDLAPPFTVMLTAPATVTFTAPAGAVTIANGQDLVLSTASTSAMRVGFGYVDSTVSPEATVDVACMLTPAGGSVTFPAVALAAAPAGKKVTVAATTAAASSITVGGWVIDFSATSNAAFPGGNNGVSVTVQ
jgi:hypothetical protein